jgi:hypothetical protein
MVARLSLNSKQEELVSTAISRLMKHPLPERLRMFGLRDDKRGKPGTTITEDILEIDMEERKFLKALCAELSGMEHPDAHVLAERILEKLDEH